MTQDVLGAITGQKAIATVIAVMVLMVGDIL
jgi:hypothetical protein